MDAMERKLPKSIDFGDVLPISVPAQSRRRKFFPVNGGEFRANGNNEIRIPISSTNALLDCEHSYLDFTITNENAAATFSVDAGGAAMFFSRLRIEQAGKVLSDTQEYNRLIASVINPVSETGEGRLGGTLKDFTQAGNQVIAPNNAPFPVAFRRGDRLALSSCGSGQNIVNGATCRFSMPIMSGLFTQDKLIPLPLVDKNNPITIVLNLDVVENYGVYLAAVPTPGSIPITKISYNAQLVEVGPDVISQFSQMRDMMGGQLALAGQDWEHNSELLAGGAAGGGGERIVNVPVRKRSIKSLFWVANSSDMANTGLAGLEQIFNKSFGGTCNMDSYQLKVGSVVYPPTPIQGPGDSAGAPSQTKRGECVQELAKAMGTLGFSAPTGRIINTLTYCEDVAGLVGPTTASGDNGVGGAPLAATLNEPIFCSPFGIDLDAFQHTAIEAGVDTATLAQQTSLILNIGAATIGAEDKTIHTWICYDKQYYFNADGSVSMSE
jgi:hypothetical protein